MLNEVLVYVFGFIAIFASVFYLLSYFSKVKEEHPKFPEQKPPNVSIVVAAWNEEKGIANNLDSLCSLDYPKGKLEIIVVDDGSTDRTFEIASEFKSKGVKVFRYEKNQGKGHALNFGIKKAKGEIIVTADADDNKISQNALKNMVAYFTNPKVMCVSPVLAIYKPKGVLQRIQQVEYLVGIFLRKAFATMNAVHITPGAFSAYRRSFFDRYGVFDENSKTEDLEMALRIQSKHYIIENSLESVVYTQGPRKFINLMRQRRRWYMGLIIHLWQYRKLFTRTYGDLGLVVLPAALATIVSTVILTLYYFIKSIIELRRELVFLESINYNFASLFEVNTFIIERFLFLLFSKPIFLLIFVFFTFLGVYMIFAKKRVKEHASIKYGIVFFILFYSFLFTFWWIVTFFCAFFNRKVKWR